MEKIIESIQDITDFVYKRLINFINIIPHWLIIFIILFGAYLSFFPSQNEEQYLLLAKQWVNPDWIYKPFNLTQTVGSRIIFQFIVGHLLQYFSFGLVVLVFRLLLIITFSIIISKIYKELSINKFQTIFHLFLFIIVFNQSFFAGSWILVSVEAKGFAYVFILLSVYYILKRKLTLSLIFLILATYIHILVGFWFTFYLFLTLIIFRKSLEVNIRSMFINIGVYILILCPYIIFLKSTVINYDQIDQLAVSSDWIYTYIRTPHHTALVPNLQYFYKKHLGGIIIAAIALFFSIIFYKIHRNKSIKFIYQYVILSLGGTLLLVSVAFIDKTGVFLKYYPYRINTLSCFLISLLITKWMYEIIKKKKYLKFLNILILLVTLNGFFNITSKNYRPQIVNVNDFIKIFRKPNNTYIKNSEDNLSDICNYIKFHTKRDALIFSFVNNLTISRRSERRRFVIYKMGGSGDLKIMQDWYFKLILKRKVYSNISFLPKVIKKYTITHILTHKNIILSPDLYEIIYSNEEFVLYKPRFN